MAGTCWSTAILPMPTRATLVRVMCGPLALAGRWRVAPRPSLPHEGGDALVQRRSRCRRRASVSGFRGDGVAAAADQEVEVGAGVGALHMVVVELGIAARWRFDGGFPGGEAGGQFLVRDVEMQAAVGHVQLDHVAGADHGQRAAARGLGRGVQDHGAIGGAGHARVRDADHVGDALAQDLGRQAHVADLGHAGIAARAAVLQHHDAGLVDIQRLVLDPGLVVVDILEHHGAAAVLHQGGRGGGGFQHRAIGRKVAFAPRRCRPIGSAAFSAGRITSSLWLRTSFTSSQTPPPETVSASLFRRPASPSALDDHGQAAGVEELLHQVFARGHQVDDGRHVAAPASQSSSVRSMPHAARDGEEVDHRVGRCRRWRHWCGWRSRTLRGSGCRRVSGRPSPSARCGGRSGAP